MAAPAAPEPPGPDDERVERPSVDELLNRAIKRRICVVIGAAGWGKTTAVATWSHGRPTAWLRHEDHDGQADRLLIGLVGALRAHVSVTTPDSDVAANPGQPAPSVAEVCASLHGVACEDLAVRYPGLQRQSAGPIDGLAHGCQQPIRVITGTAGRAADEQDLYAVRVHIGV